MTTEATGKPRRIGDDTIAYVRQLEVPLREGAASGDDSLDLLVENAHREISKQQASLCCHAKSSYVVELLLRQSSTAQLSEFAKSLEGYVPYLLTNTYGSHALQTLITQLANSAASCVDAVRSLCNEVLGQWLILSSDVSATHPLRSLLKLLAGASIDDSLSRGDAAARGSARDKRAAPGTVTSAAPQASPELQPVPRAFRACFAAVIEEFTSADDGALRACCTHDSASPLLQLLVELSARLKVDAEMLTLLCERLVGSGAPGAGTATCAFPWLLAFCRHKIASRLVESVLKWCPEPVFAAFLTELLPSLPALALPQASSFVVQAVLTSARTPAQKAECVGTLVPQVAEICAQGGLGVVWRLVESAAAAEDRDLERDVVGAVLAACTALGSPTKHTPLQWLLFQSSVPAARGGACGDGDGVDEPSGKKGAPAASVSAVGCRVVQALLTLKPALIRPVIDAFFALSSEEVLTLAKDPSGSRFVIEALIQSPAELHWARQKLFHALKGHWAELAQSRFGCWGVEKMFAVLDVNKKALLCSELADVERVLTGFASGRHLLHSCRVEHFKRDRKSWATFFTSASRKKAMFAEVLGTGSTPASAPAAPASQTPASVPASTSAPGTGASKPGSKKEKKRPRSSKEAAKEDDADALAAIEAIAGLGSSAGGDEVDDAHVEATAAKKKSKKANKGTVDVAEPEPEPELESAVAVKLGTPRGKASRKEKFLKKQAARQHAAV